MSYPSPKFCSAEHGYYDTNKSVRCPKCTEERIQERIEDRTEQLKEKLRLEKESNRYMKQILKKHNLLGKVEAQTIKENHE